MTPTRSSTDRLPWLVGAVVLIIQVVMVRDVAGPVVYADELGYIAAARYFAPGGPDVQMLSSFYHFGYGLLLSPLVALVDEPGPLYRAATLFNAGLATAATVVFHRIALLRHFEVEPSTAALAALGFGLSPSLLVNTSIVWAETALVLFITLIAVALSSLFSRPTILRALTVGALAASCYAIHPRAIVVAMAAGIVLVSGGLLRRVRWLIVLIGLVGEVIGVIGARAVNETLRAAIYTEGSFQQTAGGITEAVLGSPGQWLAGLAGTLWYQLLASAGLTGFGVLFAARAVLDRPTVATGTDGARQVWPAAAFVILALVGSWLVGGVISVADAPRIDHFFYGRYLDVFAPLLIGLGLVEIVRRQRLGLVLVTLVLLLGGGWALGFRGGDSFYDAAPVVRVNVPVANAFEQVMETWNPLLLALLGGAWCAAVMASRWWRPSAAAAAFVVGSVLIAETTLSQTIRPASHAGEERAGLARPAEMAAGQDGVVFLALPYEFWTLNGLQFWADDVQFALETECGTTATDVVIGSLGDPRFDSWVQASSDEALDRGLFLADDRVDRGAPTGPWSDSRSVRVDVVDITAADGLVTAVLDLANVDNGRALVVGDVLRLFARWSEGGNEIEDTPIELVGTIRIEPGTSGRQLIEFDAPDSVRGQMVDVMFDLRDPGRGWLSDCDDSEFTVVSVGID